MKISILALHLGFGGVEKYISTIANMLSEQHDVEILVTYKIEEIPAFFIDKKVKIKYLTTNIKPNAKAFKVAREECNIFKMIWEGLKALRILHQKNRVNKKAISACTSDVIISTRDFHNRMIQKYANKNIIWVSSEHNHHNGNQNYINKIVRSCEGFDYFLPISNELCNFYRELLPEVDVKYIPFCIDQPFTNELPTFEKPVYISVGRLSPEKGVLELIDIFNGIHERQNDAVLHLVGDGILMDQIIEKVEYYGLKDSVIIHGFITQKEIDKLYVKSSVFLMTSFTESLGFVLLEAMACGLPCIAFNSAQGANEIINNGVNGFLIENRNSENFINKTVELFNNKKEIREMSANAKKCLVDFSYDNTKKQWLTFMKNIKKHSIK